MQIKEKWLHWFEDILIHCFAWYHEQSFRINYDQKTEWHSWNSSHAFKCSNENEMQAIYDLDVTKFTSWSSSHCVRLQDQVRDLYAKSKCHQSIWSSLAHQIAAHAENEKNVELYSWMSMQLSKEQRNIIDIQWAKKHYARDKCKHISRVFHFIDFLSIFQRKFNWKMQSIENQNWSARLCKWYQHSSLWQIHWRNLQNTEQDIWCLREVSSNSWHNVCIRKIWAYIFH